MDKLTDTREQVMARLELRRPSLRGLRVSQFEQMDDLVQLVERAEGELGELNDVELGELRDQLAQGYADVRPSVENDEQVEALASVVAAIGRVDAEREQRATAAVEREQQLSAMDAAVLSTDDDSDDDAGDSDADDADESSDDDADDADDTDSGDETSDDSSQAAAGRRPDLSLLSRSRSQSRRSADTTSDESDSPFRGRVVAAAAMAEIGNGETFSDHEQLGRAIARLATDLRVPHPTERKFYLGRVQLPERPFAVRQDEHTGDDRSLLDLAVKRTQSSKLDTARKVASGGVCVPPQPDYTISVVGDRTAPWVDSLPTVTGPRPLSYFQWLNMSLTAAAGSRPGARPDGGIGTVTEAQDAVGYADPAPEGGHLPKDCVRIDCPTPTTEAPEAVFRCTTVGNFAAITWPEYVETFDNTVGFYFDVYRDEQALAKVVAAAKTLSLVGPTFGAARDVLDAMRRLVAHVRSVRKAPSLAFTFAVPAFAKYLLAQDVADSWANGTENLRVTPDQALALLAVDEGILITEYDVSIGATGTGEPTVLPELSDNAALPDWPSELRLIAYPEGAIFRHDYGELAFGLRETGVSTNDFSGFYETFESVAFRTTDLFTLDVPICVNGAAGAAVAKVCDAGSE